MAFTVTGAMRAALHLPPDVDVQVNLQSFDALNLCRLARLFPVSGGGIAKELRRRADEEEDPECRKWLAVLADAVLELARRGLTDDDNEPDDDGTHDAWISLNGGRRPVDFLLSVMNDPDAPLELRVAAAAALLP